MQQVLRQIKELLLSQTCIAIISHNNPDGDTLGSQLALAGALEGAGIETILINNDCISEKYHFVAGSTRIEPYREGMELPEVIVFVDCASLELAGYDAQTAFLQGKIIVNIDHHTSNQQYGTINYVKSQAAANCQNVYEIICALEQPITPEIATALYMGLSTDTGNFLYDNVSSETLRIAAALKDCGADTNSLRWYIYESCSRKRVELLKYILNALHISHNGKYAWSKLHYQMMQELNPDSTDIDGLITTIRDIEGVEVALLFRGVAEDKTKVSLRSKSWSDVNAIAKMFGGGGHVRAAGCTIAGNVEEAAELLIPAVKKYLETEQP
jgi:phosphoesterase RecJ-like protein